MNKKEMLALDEALDYLNEGKEIEVVNEITLGELFLFAFIKYASLFGSILILALPFIITGQIFNNEKNKKEIKNFFNNLNQFAKQYDYIIRKNMPNYGKYISVRKINGSEDLYNINSKDATFQVCLLEFDLRAFKRDFENNNNEIKDRILDVEKEYISAVYKVKDFLDTRGCPEVIKFDLMANTKSNIQDSVGDIMLKTILSDNSDVFYLGNVSIYYGKDIRKLKIPKELKKEIKFDII